VIHAGPSAWYLTANDDLGGGTFPVIDALKDRIDLVVRCTPFHSQHLAVLAERIASAHSAEEFVPGDLVFTPKELDRAAEEVRAVPVPAEVLDLLGFFLVRNPFDYHSGEGGSPGGAESAGFPEILRKMMAHISQWAQYAPPSRRIVRNEPGSDPGGQHGAKYRGQGLSKGVKQASSLRWTGPST
jgi:hypothetical protein